MTRERVPSSFTPKTPRQTITLVGGSQNGRSLQCGVDTAVLDVANEDNPSRYEVYERADSATFKMTAIERLVRIREECAG